MLGYDDHMGMGNSVTMDDQAHAFGVDHLAHSFQERMGSSINPQSQRLGYVREVIDVLLRDNEDLTLPHWLSIHEGQYFLVLIDFARLE